MEIIHVSAECYPVAKAGGLGDVVGALPKYQAKQGHTTKVVMLMYRTKFLYENEWELVHQSSQYLGPQWFNYNVIKEKPTSLALIFILLISMACSIEREFMDTMTIPNDSLLSK